MVGITLRLLLLLFLLLLFLIKYSRECKNYEDGNWYRFDDESVSLSKN